MCDWYQRLAGRPAGSPLDLVQPESMRYKVAEPILLLGKQRFANVDIRIRVKGGGRVSQIYGRPGPAPPRLHLHRRVSARTTWRPDSIARYKHTGMMRATGVTLPHK